MKTNPETYAFMSGSQVNVVQMRASEREQFPTSLPLIESTI